MKIAFIGAGKVGFSLGKYLTTRGIPVSGYFSRSELSAQQAAAFTQARPYDSLEKILEDHDLLFLTVPDGTISPLWEKLRTLPIKNKIICHCSGALSSDVFFNIEALGAFGYSVHPLFPISSRTQSYPQLAHAFSGRLDTVKALLENLGNPVQVIGKKDKEKYHASAVIAANFTVALASIGSDLLTQCGFSKDDALTALTPLMVANVENIAQFKLEGALTGPVERNDFSTVEKHLDCLDDVTRSLYKTLSLELVMIAQNKHPDRDFLYLEEMLHHEKHRNHHFEPEE